MTFKEAASKYAPHLAILGIALILNYYQVGDNTQNIKNNEKAHKEEIKTLTEKFDKEIKLLKEELATEHELQAQRSDKRYSRAMEIGKDHESRLRTLEKSLEYIKGKEGY